MARMGRHCEIVRGALTGEAEIGEQTCVSLAVLAERLERLKAGSDLFAAVEFSPEAERLRRRACAVPVS